MSQQHQQHQQRALAPLFDSKELSNVIADAMLHQVSKAIQRMQPLIAREVQQQLDSKDPAEAVGFAVQSNADAPPWQEHVPIPRWIDQGDLWGHLAPTLPHHMPTSPPAEKKNKAGSIFCYPIQEAEEDEISERIIPSVGESEELRDKTASEKTWRHSRGTPAKRGNSKISDMSSKSASSTNSRNRMQKAKKAAMTLQIEQIGIGEMLGKAVGVLPEGDDQIPAVRTGSRKFSVRVDGRRTSATPEELCQDYLPKTVSGAWRRQAIVLAAEMREDMAQEVAMAKNNMSFQGGLWWLRHMVGLRALNRPNKALMISCMLFLFILVAECMSLWLQTQRYERTASAQFYEHPLFQNLGDFGIFCSAAFGLITHHFGVKMSDVGLPSGEQDQLLQAHSVGMRYVRSWLVISKRNGKVLGIAWLCAMLTGIASKIYKAASADQVSVPQVTAGCLVFICCSGIICALCMRVIHICSAMKTSLIRYMQNLAEDDIDLERMAQEWNTIQIFIRCLCDGCSTTLLAVVLMIPVMAAGTIFTLLYADSSLVELMATMVPFATVSSMPMLCLYTAADLTQQCEQAPQVANSMLVGEWDNSLAQDLLDFMGRCQLGFFVNDMRVSNAAVIKFSYVWAAVFFTILSWSVERVLSQPII